MEYIIKWHKKVKKCMIKPKLTLYDKVIWDYLLQHVVAFYNVIFNFIFRQPNVFLDMALIYEVFHSNQDLETKEYYSK